MDWRRAFITLLVLAVIGGGILYFRDDGSVVQKAGAAQGGAAAKGPGKGPQGPPPPPQVGYIVVEPKTIPLFFDYTGTTEPSKKVEIRARVQGFLKSRDFEEGALVKQGDLLYEIDPRTLNADLEIARAQVAQAESRLSLAKRDTDRLRALRESNVISQSEFDKQSTELENSQSEISLAKAELAKAQLELSYTKITAPLTGLIEKTFKETGSLVDDGSNSLLTEILQVDPLYVTFQLSESEYLSLQQAAKDKVLVLDEGGKTYVQLVLIDGSVYDQKGTINLLEPTMDMQTGTVRYRAQFPNPDNKIKPGQYVKARIGGWVRPNTLTVPQAAVSQSPTGPFVLLVGRDNKAQPAPVKLGQWAGSDWIVTEGLKAGDRVIVDGLARVMPGAVVAPSPMSAATASTTATLRAGVSSTTSK